MTVLNFGQISVNISKMVQDKSIVSIKDEWEISCALSIGDIADDVSDP